MISDKKDNTILLVCMSKEKQLISYNSKRITKEIIFIFFHIKYQKIQCNKQLKSEHVSWYFLSKQIQVVFVDQNWIKKNIYTNCI